MFFNEIAPRTYASEKVDMNHQFIMYGNGINHTVLFLLFLPIMWMWSPILKLWRTFLQFIKFIPKFESNVFDVNWEIVGSYDENIGQYYNCLPGLA